MKPGERGGHGTQQSRARAWLTAPPAPRLQQFPGIPVQPSQPFGPTEQQPQPLSCLHLGPPQVSSLLPTASPGPGTTGASCVGHSNCVPCPWRPSPSLISSPNLCPKRTRVLRLPEFAFPFFLSPSTKQLELWFSSLREDVGLPSLLYLPTRFFYLHSVPFPVQSYYSCCSLWVLTFHLDLLFEHHHHLPLANLRPLPFQACLHLCSRLHKPCGTGSMGWGWLA